LWLPLRLWLGYQWFEAATHKVFDPKWVQTDDGHDPDQRPLCAPRLALAAFAQLLAFVIPSLPRLAFGKSQKTASFNCASLSMLVFVTYRD